MSWLVSQPVQHLFCGYQEACLDPPVPPLCPERLQRWPGRGTETQPSLHNPEIPQTGLTLGYTEVQSAELLKNVNRDDVLSLNHRTRGSKRKEGEIVQSWDVFVGWVLFVFVFLFSHTEGMWNHAVWAIRLPSSGEQTLKTKDLVLIHGKILNYAGQNL